MKATKMAKSLVTVTHTHTHTPYVLQKIIGRQFKESYIIKENEIKNSIRKANVYFGMNKRVMCNF